MSHTYLGPKDVAETKVVEFDFSDELGAGESIVSVATVEVSVITGTDASPNALRSGTAIVSGTSVLQRITGGVAGCTYHLRCVATANTGTVHVVAGDVKVINL